MVDGLAFTFQKMQNLWDAIKWRMPVFNKVRFGPLGSFTCMAGLFAKSICTSDGTEGNVGISWMGTDLKDSQSIPSLFLYLTSILHFWRTGSKKRSLWIKQFHLLFSVICRWIWVGGGGWVWGLYFKNLCSVDFMMILMELHLHSSPLCGLQVDKLPMVLIIGNWAEHRWQLVWGLTARCSFELCCMAWGQDLKARNPEAPIEI